MATHMRDIWWPPNGVHGGHMVTCVTMHVEEVHGCSVCVSRTWVIGVHVCGLSRVCVAHALVSSVPSGSVKYVIGCYV